MSEETFKCEAGKMMSKTKRVKGNLKRRFNVLFGVSLTTCSQIWGLIYFTERYLQPKHLLWALLFLKCYAFEEINCIISDSDNKTFRKWVWKVIKILSKLKQVRFKMQHARNFT